MKCPHHPTCPGCPLLEHPYDRQLALKKRRLAAALACFPHLPEAPEVLPALHTAAYRHRLKLPVDVGGRDVAIGLYHRDRKQVLDTPDCPVLVPALQAALEAMKPWLKRHPEVHSVDLRASDHTGELQLVLAAAHGAIQGGDRALKALTKAIPELASIAVSTADPERKRVMGRRPRLAKGKPTIEEAIDTTRYRLYPGAFFQADPRNARQLHALVHDLVGDATHVMDLYAGVGAYGLMLATDRHAVLCVEEVPQAAQAAADMAPANVRVVRSRVEDLRLDDRYQVAIINPARRGSDPHSLKQLATLVDRIVYVSCGPEALARDLDALASHGMIVDKMYAIDLFPHTREVETIVHLTRGKPRRTWRIQGGRAGGPWLGHPSGAVGRQEEAAALVLGQVPPSGRLGEHSFERVATVAGHSLVHIRLRGPLHTALRAFARRGHPTAGRDNKTARFFATKAGLQRPFEHVLRADGAWAPLHGDLVLALRALGAGGAEDRLRPGRRRKR